MITINQAQQLSDSLINQLQEELIDSFGSFYKLSMGELIALASKRESNFIQDIGNAIYQWSKNGLTQRRQKEAMERVATNLENKLGMGPYPQIDMVPTTQDILNGLQEEMTSFDLGLFGDLGIKIVEDVSKASVDLVEGTVEVGGSVLKSSGEALKMGAESSVTILKDLPKYAPWIIGVIVVGVAAYAVTMFSKVSK